MFFVLPVQYQYSTCLTCPISIFDCFTFPYQYSTSFAVQYQYSTCLTCPISIFNLSYMSNINIQPVLHVHYQYSPCLTCLISIFNVLHILDMSNINIQLVLSALLPNVQYLYMQ